MAKSGAQIRFAALVRVSTEKQKQKGESLAVQRKHLTEDVARLGGKIVAWYGGQEHATPGHDTIQVDRLVSDGAAGKFDAVIVSHQDRWSRDNAKSKAGIAVFRQHGIRFFVRCFEYDLDNATQRFQLAMSVDIGELNASIQSQKSLESRIELAKQGWQTAGKPPFGRLFNRRKGKWEVIPEKQAMIKDVAARYLAGESLADLATEYGVNHSNLHKTLMQRCGTDWEQTFRCDDLKIDDTIKTKIPRLLPEKTIKAIRDRAGANRTYKRKKDDAYFKNKYLLSGLIFCDHCGYAMFGQMNHPNKPGAKKSYYRHLGDKKRVKLCPCKHKTWIDAKIIEKNVLRKLFEVFGNPKAVERAIEEAIPNPKKVAELRNQESRLTALLADTDKGVKRIVDLAADGTLSKSEVKEKIAVLREQKENHEEKLQKIKDQLEHLPGADLIRTASENAVEQFHQAMFPAKRGERKIGLIEINGRLSAKLHFKVQQADDCLKNMSWDDRRALMESVFAGHTPDGKRAGVYIEWALHDGKPRWRYSIRGLINEDSLLPSGINRGAIQSASR